MSARTLTDTERAERRARDLKLAEDAVDALRSSAGWRDWLRVRALTGPSRYSLLIWRHRRWTPRMRVMTARTCRRRAI